LRVSSYCHYNGYIAYWSNNGINWKPARLSNGGAEHYPRLTTHTANLNQAGVFTVDRPGTSGMGNLQPMVASFDYFSITPLVDEVVAAGISAGIRGDARQNINLPVEFNVWIDAFDITEIGYAELVFETDNLLNFNDSILDAELGLSVVDGFIQRQLPNGNFETTVRLVKTAQPLALDGLNDILNLLFSVQNVGNTTIYLRSVEIGAWMHGKSVIFFAGIAEDQVSTMLFRMFDLTRDGTIGDVDFMIAAVAVGMTDEHPDWNSQILVQGIGQVDVFGDAITYAMADFNGDGRVDMLDLAAILRAMRA